MIDSINNSSSLSSAALQSANIGEQEAQKQRQAEETSNQQVQSPNQDSVSITADAVAAPEATASTSITNADEAAATASRVANLFQSQPELAATAQGGKLTAEKADAYLKASVG